jgi:hypothetical protein
MLRRRLSEDVVAGVDRTRTMSIKTLPALRPAHAPWNKGRIVGQKRPLLPKHVWSIRVQLVLLLQVRVARANDDLADRPAHLLPAQPRQAIVSPFVAVPLFQRAA